MTNLLWLTQNYYPQKGGMAQSCDRIVNGLRRHGINIDVVHFSSRFSSIVANKKLFGHDISCPIDDDIAHSLNKLWCFLPNIGLRNYDCIIAFGGYIPMFTAPVFSAWLQVKLYTFIRGNDFDHAILDPKRQYLLDKAFKSSHSVLVVSQDKKIKINTIWPEVNIQWVPNGIDIDLWCKTNTDIYLADAFRKEYLNFNNKRHVVGLFGHIKQKKGMDYFIQSVLKSTSYKNLHLLIVGDIDEQIKIFLDSHQDKITYTHVSFIERYQLIPYYLACDFIAIPSYYEGMPNVMLESLALGIPILASTVGGMDDFLINSIHGYLFSPGDINTCSDALTAAMNVSSSDYLKMKQACMKLVSDSLTSDKEIEKYLSIFL